METHEPHASDTPLQNKEGIKAAQTHLRNYLNTYEEQTADLVESGAIPSRDKRLPDRDELQEARQIITEFMLAGEFPLVSVPAQYIDNVMKEGLIARPTWMPDVSVIAGTIGAPPYLPADEKRVVLELRVPPQQIAPRITGVQRAFQGVVVVENTRVDPSRLRLLDEREIQEKIVREVMESAKTEPLDVSRFLRALRGFFGDAFEKKATRFEGYRIEEHVTLVLNQFEKYVESAFIAPFRRDLFRILLAVHDIGKADMNVDDPKSKALEHPLTLKRVKPFLQQLHVDSRNSAIILALLSGDPIGKFVQGEFDLATAASGLVEAARQAEINPRDFFTLQLAYYQSDTSAYTVDAGGKKSLDGMFVKKPDLDEDEIEGDVKAKRFAAGKVWPLEFTKKTQAAVMALQLEVERLVK